MKSNTNYDAWSEEQKKSVNLDAKAINALFCALNKEEFNRVLIVISAHQIWQILQITHEGTNIVKESKISILLHKFELFKMKENEIIAKMITRFTDITKSLVALGKEYTQVKKVSKILHALTSDWEKNYCHRRSQWFINAVIREPHWKLDGIWSSNWRHERRMNNINSRRKFSPFMHLQTQKN